MKKTKRASVNSLHAIELLQKKRSETTTGRKNEIYREIGDKIEAKGGKRPCDTTIGKWIRGTHSTTIANLEIIRSVLGTAESLEQEPVTSELSIRAAGKTVERDLAELSLWVFSRDRNELSTDRTIEQNLRSKSSSHSVRPI